MKYIKLYPTLVFSFILSSLSVTSSAIEETITYGTAPSPWGIDPGLKQVPSTGRAGGSNGGGSYHPPEYKTGMDEQARKESEGKKAWCRANNYPTVAPFCAGYKEQDKKREECIAKAESTTKTCNDAYETLNNMCVATAGLVGRGAGWAGSKLISDPKLIELAKSAATFAGFEADIMSASCSGLNERAQKYCVAGGAKMASQCN